MTTEEAREIVLSSLLSQLKTARNARKRDALRYKIRDAMKPFDHVDVPGIAYLQLVQRPSVKCGSCDNVMLTKPEVEVIWV